MSHTEKAYFASGCFWCITPSFQEKVGVRSVTSGYCGGQEENPTYEDVKQQKTGHRETVMVEYNPEKIGFAQLLEVFLNNVDPFDAEGQFIDRGFSYTLAIYYTDDTQYQLSQKALESLSLRSGKPTAVALEPFRTFWKAEEYHQDYHKKNPEAFRRELIESGRLKQLT
ncbi:MAG: peptide-methionine (S)-S-oxide reductase MsrA [Oscillospiraceae bacterium]|nr:peptide-methionine (S)-S-oxide reductase MsrA [Oscillospiraceae bacterium]